MASLVAFPADRKADVDRGPGVVADPHCKLCLSADCFATNCDCQKLMRGPMIVVTDGSPIVLGPPGRQDVRNVYGPGLAKLIALAGLTDEACSTSRCFSLSLQ